MSFRPTAPHGDFCWWLLRPLAAALFCVYIVWHGLWLCHGRLAPSLMIALTGLPAPTTGMTRSLQALIRGDVRVALVWHPLSLPLSFLFLGSILWLCLCAWRRQRLVLPEWIWRTWAALLIASWGAKFLIGPNSW